MTIAAKISSTELTAQVTARFSGKYLEGRLIDATGTSYIPGTTEDRVFLGLEPLLGTGGYQRQVIKYESSDILAYSDDGVPLDRKATVFAHDGGGTSIDFSHVALVWSTGNAVTLGAVTAAPSAGVDGTYTNIPVTTLGGEIREVGSFNTTTAFTASQTGAAVTISGGSGTGATATVDTDSSGDVVSVAITGNGSNYVTGDTITITEVGGTPGVATATVTVVDGANLLVDLTISNSGAATTDYALTIAAPGHGFEDGDAVTILDGTLAGLGAITGGAGDLVFSVATTSTDANSGNILSVAETASAVVLTGGNEAVFYWDLKQFGFYSV
jgi:hypothetical protein